MRHSDIIVVGAGISGLMAAITAAKSSKTVSVLSRGAGVLSIGSGAVDLLGYSEGKLIKGSPFDFIDKLDKMHPYSITGKDVVRQSLDFLTQIAERHSLYLRASKDGVNKTAVTVMGTLRPTYISTESANATPLFSAKKVLVAGIEYLKDFQPQIAIRQLKEYQKLSHVKFDHTYLQCPEVYKNTVLNCLNFARYADKVEGESWLLSEIERVKSDYDLILLPPVCGVARHNEIYSKLQSKNINIVEMVSIPPGVGGMRLRTALYAEAKSLPIRFTECCEITHAHVENGRCVYLESDLAGVKTHHYADKYIIATGGILGGGIITQPSKMKEAIFGIKIDCPQRVEDWTQKDVFANHAYVTKGVSVSNAMKPMDSSGKEIIDNVFFSGRILEGYDFAKEKSGYGVAVATGYYAAQQAVK